MAGYELVAILDTESEAIQDLADYERLYHRCMDLGFIMHKVRTFAFCDKYNAEALHQIRRLGKLC